MANSHLSESSQEFITLGRINGVYGVKGWIKVYSFTAPIENILNYKTWQLSKNNQNKAVSLVGGKKHGKGIIAKLEGYDSREDIALLLTSEIRIARNLLPNLPEGEYYWRDLVGLKVVNVAGVEFGHVDHVFDTGANDVLVVKGKSERLIPFIQGQCIKKVDLNEGVILVDWPEDFE